MEAPVPDPRLEFLGSYVQKTLKLKPEKWGRLLMTEELKKQIVGFLDNPDPPILIVMQNAAAQLLLGTSFPVSLKSKATYFIKKKNQAVPKENIADHLVLGDMATKHIEQLATLVDEIFVPLLSNPSNHKKWPPIVAQDVKKHIHSLKSTVYEVKGQVSGQTVLPMPVGVEKVHEAERLLRTSGGEDVDLYLKSAIEGVVIKWATQINDVLTKDSSEAFAGGQNPNPSAEMHFWNSRLKNLEYIYDQLRDERVRKMAIILEKTDSAYFPCFKNLFLNIVAALAEAKDICLYLKPLVKHLTALENTTEFSDLTPQLKPLLHVVCLIWANSKYYCNSAKIIVLMKQICNLLIELAQHFLDPSSLFQSDVDEAMQRIELSVSVFKSFRKAFDECKNNMAYYFKDRKIVQWTFHPKMVFERFEQFLSRLQTIQWFFETVQEFIKLEKIEIGGIKGRNLSSRIVAISHEFNEYFAVFATKTYNVLDPEDEAFLLDYSDFQKKITDLDRRLASILCQAFDDCHNLESALKLINILGTILERPLIKQEFTAKYRRILDMLISELDVCQELYDEQMSFFKENGHMKVYKFLPALSGAFQWCNQLRMRIQSSVTSFKSVDHPTLKCPEAESALEKNESLMTSLKQFEESYFEEWASSVEEKCTVNLGKSLLTRKKENAELCVNFDPDLVAILREVHYLKLMEKENIPQAALDVSEREEAFRSYTARLNQTKDWYNKIRRVSASVEFNLIKDSIKEIDENIEKGQTELNWNSPSLSTYVNHLFQLVGDLERKVQNTQDNVNAMRNVMTAWLKNPLFERKEGRKDSLLCLEEKTDRIQKRYAEMKGAADEIRRMLEENIKLFDMTNRMDSPAWKKYLQYIDSIIASSLLRTIGCSLGYLAENMDSTRSQAPLFEVHLELLEPDIVFVPSLDPESSNAFIKIIEGLISDIFSMATLIPRIATDTAEDNYRNDIETNPDMIEMRNEITEGVKTVTEEATEFASGFENYSYLWLDDRQSYLAQFLAYGRQLTMEEMDLVAANDPTQPKLNSPKIDDFREQIDNFENLFNEIEELESFQIFNGWFQVDLRPFKQALLNTVRKWGNMFKEHLVDHVTSSLADLANFIRKADEGLLQNVQEGDYEALVNVMGYLMHVKERQAATDDMFEPIRQTIELLKSYDQELPEEINVFLQELPEQWNNTKKIATTVKQQVAPLQAGEVSCIRKRIQAFDVSQNQYRENFKKYEFMRYDCDKPYELLDKTNLEMKILEDEMKKIQESASLFEVNVPEFKPLKQCRKEIKMLKQLWDYVNIVQSCIDDWKTTPWRKVDVENMDIECKKFAKEIRALDKEMRVWDTYITLEAHVKNMLTSLKAVGELQNPAIRERHWTQLMSSTKVCYQIPKLTGYLHPDI